MKTKITEKIDSFSNESKDINHRYYSFDFCYSYFRSSKEKGTVDIERSCYVLWGYLASWGMLRGSSFLLSKNPSYLKGLVEWIYNQPISTWDIDVKDYKTKGSEIIELYKSIRKYIIPEGEKNRDITLVTKILLGVFAIVPAYDEYFSKTFKNRSKEYKEIKSCGFTSFNQSSLDVIYQFYIENKDEIDNLSKSYKVIDFYGKETKYHYSKAKIIDMYGFQAGLEG